MKTNLLAACLTIVLALEASAQAKPPTLDRLFPPGAQRGKTVAVTASGSFDRWPVQGWADDPGIEVKAGKEKGALSVTVAPDVHPGLHWLRLADEEGASALKPFMIGTLPERLEVESDDAPTALDDAHVTINGRLARRGDVDAFAVPLKQGQTLVAAIEANRRLGSPMDAVLQVASSEGFVLAQEDDDQGFDPLLAFEAPADGTYVVRLFAFPATPNSSIAFAGDNTFIYRLTLTTGGYLTYSYPMAVPRSDPGLVEAHGWNLPADARRLAVPVEGASETAPVAHPSLANAVDVRLESHLARAEQEPSDQAHPQAVTIPCTITGRIAPARDRDVFAFPAKKGQAVAFRVEARTLGAPLDPVLRVCDARGALLSEVDDMGRNGRDPQLSFTPPADGTYRLIVRDLHGQGGDRYVYRLSGARPEPDFQLTVSSDRLTLTPGKPTTVAVTVDRKEGFKLPVVIRAEDLPDGVTATPVRSEAGKPSAKSVSLVLTTQGGPWSGPVRIAGSVPDGSLTDRPARATIAGFATTTDRLWLTVLRPPAPPKK
jgi:hypothetical protein